MTFHSFCLNACKIIFSLCFYIFFWGGVYILIHHVTLPKENRLSFAPNTVMSEVTLTHRPGIWCWKGLSVFAQWHFDTVVVCRDGCLIPGLMMVTMKGGWRALIRTPLMQSKKPTSIFQGQCTPQKNDAPLSLSLSLPFSFFISLSVSIYLSVYTVFRSKRCQFVWATSANPCAFTHWSLRLRLTWLAWWIMASRQETERLYKLAADNSVGW